ncbi:MAG: FtsW/RodA/SpoVE family cell cycle protein, partial [Chloroflexi bacterium]|nr:FtsW/RodA/SpoVE family cell cycle protein [Chloroflexota bacterium]
KVGLLPFAFMLGAMAGLIIAQPDLSTGILLIVTATAMLFVAGADLKQLSVMGLTGALGLALTFVVLVKVFHHEAAIERYDRVRMWIENPLSDPLNEGFQVVQALAALTMGGFKGVGLGQSQQKFAIYAPHSDCIIAIIGEETGLVGIVAVLALYVLWAWRGYRIAWRSVDDYGRLLAVGLVTWVLAGAALHISVNTGTLPFTGDVLPFISSGGSSLVSGLAAVGILLNISRVSRESALTGKSGRTSSQSGREHTP